jgi:hypothetical protein
MSRVTIVFILTTIEENHMKETLIQEEDSSNQLFEGTNPIKDSRAGIFGRMLLSWATPLVKVLLLFKNGKFE